MAKKHKMYFFVSDTIRLNQTAFYMANGNPYMFFVGKLKDYDNMVGSSDLTHYAGYLMKYATIEGENLVNECCRSYNISYESTSDSYFSYSLLTTASANHKFTSVSNSYGFS